MDPAEWILSQKETIAHLERELAEARTENRHLRYAARGGNAKRDTADLLTFMADRLVAEYGEDEATDWVRAAYERSRMLQTALARLEGK